MLIKSPMEIWKSLEEKYNNEKQEEGEIFCIYESQEATMVSSGEGAATETRMARFLKPCAKDIIEAGTSPPKRSASSSTAHLKKKEHPNLQVTFGGWCSTPVQWSTWLHTLLGKHVSTWKKAGICDALLCSMYDTTRYAPMITGLVEHWCPETNTFVFPWGEATITLEDIMVLGGFSVLGEPLSLCTKRNKDSDDDDMLLEPMIQKLEKLKIELLDGMPPLLIIPQYEVWMRFFMEVHAEGHELEHVGFLSLWLSLFVFPYFFDPEKSLLLEPIIDKSVFRIAVHLAQGTRLALAQAVLAGLYENLTKFKLDKGEPDVRVMGPFRLVQLWVFERFPILQGPKWYKKRLDMGEPRAALWEKVELSADIDLSLIETAFQRAPLSFQWRPYTAALENWCCHYKDNEQFVADCSNSTEELRSFGLCLCADNLEGVFTVQKYMPHRVARQFGMDQHLPGEYTVVDKEKFSFYVPASSYKPCVSMEYLEWWTGSSKRRRKARDSGPKKKRGRRKSTR